MLRAHFQLLNPILTIILLQRLPQAGRLDLLTILLSCHMFSSTNVHELRVSRVRERNRVALCVRSSPLGLQAQTCCFG